MGDDAVTECSSYNNGPFTGRLSYNPGKSNRVVEVDKDLSNLPMLSTISSSVVDGTAYCKVNQTLHPPLLTGENVNEVARPKSEPYYIFLVSGNTRGNGLSIHNTDLTALDYPFVSPQEVDLQRYKRQGNNVIGNAGTDQNNTSPPPLSPEEQAALMQYRKTLVHVHAFLMLIGWSFFLTTGILCARYLKGNFPNTKPFGIHVWFHLHRTMNMMGIACTIGAFVCIFVAKDWRWSGPSVYNTTEQNREWGAIHSIIGLLACCLAWAQPLNAVFRCSPGASYRIIFNIIHGVSGTLAWLGALTATMIAVVHFAPQFTNQKAAMALYIVFVAVTGIVIIFNQFLSIRIWMLKRNAVHSSEIEMVQIKNGKTVIERSEDVQKIYNLRLITFACFLIVAIGCIVAICILIGLS
uniref:Cytochrome b561 domain-containing protein n=1 Tax=Rhabditophanes sp. KR3021 TaxID=114890 RepID=A0AC35U5W1_9BILA